MRFLIAFLCGLSFALSGTLPDGVDNVEDLDIEDFEDYFGLDHVTDPEEKEKRKEALKENEEMVKEANEAYNNGDQTWYDEVNEWADLPLDEFLNEHTGLLMNVTERFATGLLDIRMPYDEVSERYFDGYRFSRSSAPAAYNAVTAGLVTSVKSQGNCGSCAAFATMATVETCFAKQLGGASNVGDYSEQHILDCGYDGVLNNGCNGAAPHGYAKYLSDKKPNLSSETAFPYKGVQQSCPSSYTTFFQGASVTGAYWTESGTEDTLKALVAEHGAVMTGVYVDNAFMEYKGGIYAGCSSGSPNHAVVVVGYGTESGTDFWLIKNSWGSGWGESGYMRLKRGAGMCGVGGTIVHMKCAKASGTTSATQATTTASATTTAASSDASCTDKYGNCPQIAENWCWIAKMDCCKSCGLGKGMTPAQSNTCYDEYDNCSELCDFVPDSCKKSCNKC